MFIFVWFNAGNQLFLFFNLELFLLLFHFNFLLSILCFDFFDHLFRMIKSFSLYFDSLSPNPLHKFSMLLAREDMMISIFEKLLFIKMWNPTYLHFQILKLFFSFFERVFIFSFNFLILQILIYIILMALLSLDKYFPILYALRYKSLSNVPHGAGWPTIFRFELCKILMELSFFFVFVWDLIIYWLCSWIHFLNTALNDWLLNIFMIHADWFIDFNINKIIERGWS